MSKLKKINVVVISSRFNEDIVNNLYLGVERCFIDSALEVNIHRAFVPGAFELPYMAKQFVDKDAKYSLKKSLEAAYSLAKVDCIITLGCIIKGETAHFEYISNACSNTLASLTLQSKIPIMFGVITAYDKDQAIARSETDFNSNKNLNIGYNVADAAIKTLLSLEDLKGNINLHYNLLKK